MRSTTSSRTGVVADTVAGTGSIEDQRDLAEEVAGGQRRQLLLAGPDVALTR